MTAAAYTDVEVALGRSLTGDAEIAQVEYWLESAELLIGVRLGDVSELDQDVLKYVEVEAVLARMQNPNGYQSETIDDYTYRYGTESRRVSILDEWWDLLTPDSSSEAFSIRPYGEPGWSEPDAWISPTEQV